MIRKFPVAVLSGTRHGAGGIGGLLGPHRRQRKHFLSFRRRGQCPYYRARKTSKRATNTDMSAVQKDFSGAAIICVHAASVKHPIMLAERSVPEEPADTGWQFLCSKETHENAEDARIWSLQEIVEFEPSLKGLLNRPPGTTLHRVSPDSPWRIRTQRAQQDQRRGNSYRHKLVKRFNFPRPACADRRTGSPDTS